MILGKCKLNIINNIYLHMLACIQLDLYTSICLDLMSMHDNIHSSHLCAPS